MVKEIISTEIPNLTQSVIDRFFSKVALTANDNKCWEWLGSKRRNGYGRISITVSKNKDKSFSAHRMSYLITNKTLPLDKVVMHSCDNPSCVNPKHLSLGTNKDNTNDMMKKGRVKKIFKDGEKHPNSKLKNEDIFNIRNLLEKGKTQKFISELYGVNQSLISYIKSNKYWNHI